MKFLKKMILTLVILIATLSIGTYIFMQGKQFGKAPSGKRLERILKSPHYKDGKFQNLNPTPQLAEDTSMPKVLFNFFFSKVENATPKKKFHFTKTDLKNLNPKENFYVWMGHSSYFLQIDGKKILVDPVFSGSVSPLKFTNKAFDGTDIYTTEDIPELDYLVITHDHWDHLDYETVTKLRPKVKQVITGLGTGAHLESWDFEPSKIVELDWFESQDLGNGFKINAEPARHFSGRGFKRDQAIWASFVLETPNSKIYIGGDSGYDNHFKKIGEKYGKLDLAILETGQYNPAWKYIHMLPGEQLQAMKDLNAQRMIAVHNSKFKLALHSWYEPMEKLHELNKEKLRVITPKIGEKVFWQDDNKIYPKWWEEYQ